MTLNQDATRISYYLGVGDYDSVRMMISVFSSEYLNLVKSKINSTSKVELIELLS